VTSGPLARGIWLNATNNAARLKWAMIFQCVLCIGAVCSAQSKAPVVAKLDRICGKLEKTRFVSDKAAPSIGHTNAKSLSASELNLFVRTADAPCCVGVAIATVKTNHWGNFNFKNVSAGPYWLVATVEGKDVQMPVDFKPDQRSTTLCSEQFFDVDENYNFGMSATVTVD
jgi:hypothetical protein